MTTPEAKGPDWDRLFETARGRDYSKWCERRLPRRSDALDAARVAVIRAEVALAHAEKAEAALQAIAKKMYETCPGD